MKQPLAVLGLLALAACQPRTPKPAASDAASIAMPAAPATVIDVSRPLTARGAEPFWSLTIDGTHMTLSRPDKPDLALDSPGSTIQSGRATWIAKAADGQQVTVILYAGDCSDGMSDRKYPFAAEVTTLNEALHGCAGGTADLRQPGG